MGHGGSCTLASSWAPWEIERIIEGKQKKESKPRKDGVFAGKTEEQRESSPLGGGNKGASSLPS